MQVTVGVWAQFSYFNRKSDRDNFTSSLLTLAHRDSCLFCAIQLLLLTDFLPSTGMCCKKMMSGWRNAWSMKSRAADQEEDQRRPGERLWKKDCQGCKLNTEDAMDRSRWRKLIKDVPWSGWVWEGECFFWYCPTWVVLDKKPLNGCVCVTYYKTLWNIKNFQTELYITPNQPTTRFTAIIQLNLC